MKGLKQLWEVSLQQPLTLRGTLFDIIKFVFEIKYTSINTYLMQFIIEYYIVDKKSSL